MESEGQVVNKVVLLDVDLIIPNPSQPRVEFKEEDINTLANSILENGLLQPITVRKNNDFFEIVSGERRLRAVKSINKNYIACIIIETTHEQSAIFSLLENLQREDLNCFEEATAIKRLIDEWGFSQQEVGKRLGKAQSTVANKLRLLRIDDETRKKLLENNIVERQTRAFLRIDDEKLRSGIIDYVIAKKMNIEQTERYISNILNNNIVSDKKNIKRNFHPIVKDVRIFLNTINNAINLMNESGIKAISEKTESEEFIEYVVKIPISTNSKNIKISNVE